MTEELSNDEKLAHTIANIMGESSAAADALKYLNKLRQEGKTARIEPRGNVWVVISE